MNGLGADLLIGVVMIAIGATLLWTCTAILTGLPIPVVSAY